MGQTFVIVSASSVSDTFAAVNGLAINGSEHFTITYNGTNVVLQVVSGALVTTGVQVTRAVRPGLMLPGLNRGLGSHGFYGPSIYDRLRAASAAATTSVSLGHPAPSLTHLNHSFGIDGHIGVVSYGRRIGQLAPAVPPPQSVATVGPAPQGQHGLGMHGFRPMDQTGALAPLDRPVWAMSAHRVTSPPRRLRRRPSIAWAK